MTGRKQIILATLCAVAIAIGCSQRRSQPVRGPLVLETESLRNGQRQFMSTCHQCHPNGERGLGPSLNDKPLPSFLMKKQVRIGAGAMPYFTEQQISDRDLDDLIAYVQKLRGHTD